MISAGNRDDTIRTWNLAGPEPNEEFVLRGINGVASLMLSPDGKLLFAGQINGPLLQWNLTEPESRPTVVLDKSWVRAVLLDAENRPTLAVSGHESAPFEVWKLEADKPAQLVYSTSGAGVRAAQFSPDGKLLACQADKLYVLDATGAEIKPLAILDSPATTIAFAPDSRSLAAVGGGDLKIWDLTQSPALPRVTLHGPNLSWCAATYTPDGTRLFAADRLGATIGWDLATGKLLRRPQKAGELDPVLARMPGFVFQLLPSPDSRYLATANCDGSIYILRIDGLVARAIPDGK